MYSSIEVNVYTLLRAEQVWREQSQGAAQAARVVADAGTSGFDPAVSSAVQTFLDAWSTVAQQIADNVEAVETGLNEFRNAFGQFETQTTNDFTSFGDGFMTDRP